MNRFTLKISGDGIVADCVKIHSTLDRTQSLAIETVEDVQVGKDDVTVIRNYHESQTARLDLEGLRMSHGRLIFRPSRQQAFSLYRGRKIQLDLGPGESCVVRSEKAVDPRMRSMSDQVSAGI